LAASVSTVACPPLAERGGGRRVAERPCRAHDASATPNYPGSFLFALDQRHAAPTPSATPPPPCSRSPARRAAPPTVGRARSLPTTLHRVELAAVFVEPEPRRRRLPAVSSAGVELLALPSPRSRALRSRRRAARRCRCPAWRGSRRSAALTGARRLVLALALAQPG
jgi:hypothetical protein